MASLVRSESFNSNPESPASPSKNQSETTIAEQDLDFDSKTYANELLEHGLKEERFRIDRKKLEDMLQIHQRYAFEINVKDYSSGGLSDFIVLGQRSPNFSTGVPQIDIRRTTIKKDSNNAAENAEVFFQRVMMETSTLVTWPSKLKIGAKSKKAPIFENLIHRVSGRKLQSSFKDLLVWHSPHLFNMATAKDPHVKIVGKPEAVQQAKEKILEILDTKKNRVTLKMDVSHSDHSYIIGKGGFKIQQVMEETGCHIHFPDSNKPKPRVAFPCFKPSIADLRNNLTTEKSNQVSIAGQAAGVELARAKIRDLLPFVYMFELPNGETVNPGEECSPAIQHIQQTYSFNVAFRLTTIGRTVVIVRGCQRLLSRLRQGLSLLMEYLTGSKTVPVMGFMKTEIAAQHHHFVMGNCNVNIQMIMNKTGATVTFPDSSSFSPDSPTQTIPVLAGHSVMRSKSTVIIQGSFDSVCMAWQEIIKCLPLVLMFDLKEGQELDPVMVNNFVETFNINITVRPKIKENTKSVLISGTEKDCKVLFKVRKEILGLDEDDSSSSPTRPRAFQVPCNGKISEGKNSISSVAQNLSTAESINLLSAIIQQNPQIVGLLSNLSSAIPTMNPPDVLPHVSLPNPVYRTAVQNQVNQISMDQYAAKRDVENWINHHDRGYTLQDGSSTKRNLGDDDVDSADSGIYVHRRNRFQHVLEAKNEVSSQPESSASSTSSNDTPDYKVNAFFKRMSQSNEPTLGTEVHHLLADYGNKKLSANKAMQQQIGDGVRTPTQLWSGYGFSKSMPDYAARMKKATRNSGSITEYLDMDNSKSSATWSSDLVDKNDSPTEAISPFSFSNFWENIPKQPTIDYGTIKTVEQLLNLLDLQKYSEVLGHHEIDLITLLTLTDIDLQQLGISYGARRKMLAAIAAIRDHRLGDCLKNFRAAPGAERKTFLTRYPPGSPISDDNGARM